MIVIGGFLLILLLATLNAVPCAFFLMLFLGNLGFHLGFLDLLPGAVAFYCFKNNVISYNYTKEIR